MLKKLIKELSLMVPAADQLEEGHNVEVKSRGFTTPEDGDGQLETSSSSKSVSASRSLTQQHGDRTTESQDSGIGERPPTLGTSSKQTSNASTTRSANPGSMRKSPGEIAFFKLLHSELKKASHFFDRATAEFLIREERVREGMVIMKQPNAILVQDKWSLMATSIYRLYKDLLLLETYAIMSYCAFSKILKKHDKMTGYSTRGPFMLNKVSKVNFASYPEVLLMINRCEVLYEEVSQLLGSTGDASFLEDERLFINMIHRLNETVLSTDTDNEDRLANNNPMVGTVKRPAVAQLIIPSSSSSESQATSTVRSLVEEINETNRERVESVDHHLCSTNTVHRQRKKRISSSLPPLPSTITTSTSKKQRSLIVGE